VALLFERTVCQCDTSRAGAQVDASHAINAAGVSRHCTFHNDPLIGYELGNGGSLRYGKYAKHLQARPCRHAHPYHHSASTWRPDATNVEYPDDFAESLMLMGESLAAGGNPAKAMAVLQEARLIREPIVSAPPARIDYRRGLARLYTDMGDALVALRSESEAEIWYRKGLDLWNELQGQHALWAKEIDKPKEVAEDLLQLRSARP
jgi:hypothetical protein